MKMYRKVSCLGLVFVLSAMLALGLGYVDAQTPGMIPMFDPGGAPGVCNADVGVDCVDSVISQDASGNLVIGPPGNNVFIVPSGPGGTIDLGPVGGAQMFVRDSCCAAGALRFANSGGANFIQSGINTLTGSAAPLRFTSMNAANTWMTIDSGGKVGIGTTNPVGALDVSRNAADTVFSLSSIGAQRWQLTSDTFGSFSITRQGAVGNPPILISPSGNVGIGLVPALEEKFGVFGDSVFQGFVRVGKVDTGGTTNLCRNNTNNRISSCGSSLRYKTEVRGYSAGLDIVKRLRPIAFTWKQGGMRDVGLAAEDVEQVEPLLTFRNDKGEIEGVKYDRLSAVFVNAFAEQQAQIQRQAEQMKRQQRELAALKVLVCSSHPDADVCR
jgi:hypothetical protein